MDLEHTNLGKHCEVPDCHQRDFLPFTCDVCSKKLCLNHRTYGAHSCHGNQTKDMTSIDCPLCGKSVKFAKSDDIDSIWNEHYKTVCTQSMRPKSVTKCHEESCQIILGPSNNFTCNKCKQQVCLTHRRAEDHHCMGMRGAILSKLPSQTVKPINPVRPVSNKLQSNTNAVSKNIRTTPGSLQTPPPSSSSNIKAQSSETVNLPKESLHICPLCNIPQLDSTSLEIHINTEHDEISSISHSNSAPMPIPMPMPMPITTANNNPRAREVLLQ